MYIQKPLLDRYFPESLNYRIMGILIFWKKMRYVKIAYVGGNVLMTQITRKFLT
jgi:hypothetical protein